MAAQAGSGRGGARWRVPGWTAAASVLLLPAAAMRFTDEVAWEAHDFALFAAMLGLAGGAVELAARRTADGRYRAGVAVAAAAAFLLIWVVLAVGAIGAADDLRNLAFAGVLGVGLVAAFVARGRPAGMARAAVLTAAAQGAAGLYALAVGHPGAGLASAGFAIAWLIAAGLFRRAG